MAADALSPEAISAALAARAHGKDGHELPPVAFTDIAKTYHEELPHQLERLKWLAQHDKLSWPGVAIRSKHLRAADAILQALAEAEPYGAVKPGAAAP